MLAIICVLSCVALVVVMFYLSGTAMPSLVGLMSGAVTNTPGLGAAQQTVKDLSVANTALTNLPPLGGFYAIAYPGGVVGIILVMIFLKWIFKVDLQKEQENYLAQNKAAAPKPATLTLRIENPLLIGKQVATLLTRSKRILLSLG